MASERFAVTAETGPEPGASGESGAVVLSLEGELDHDTADILRQALEERNGAALILVDCERLSFCDSTGLNVLLRARLQALESGGRLELAGLRPPVSRMFEITGARTVFRVYENVAEALTDRRAGG
ncbi:STAS domain-containing protein [Streptomyces sp. NPDC058579]|uniref:STAS domain-containing protein n=1 Tax=Streptomyces sp. NPDC058579 TaxID=3346548 RepID=UPI003655223B